jgi:hypothetical protein
MTNGMTAMVILARETIGVVVLTQEFAREYR